MRLTRRLTLVAVVALVAAVGAPVAHAERLPREGPALPRERERDHRGVA